MFLFDIYVGDHQGRDEEKEKVGSTATARTIVNCGNHPEIFLPGNAQSLALDFSALSNLYKFSYAVLRAATNKFAASNLVGEGGFGMVYQGWIDCCTMTAARPGEGLRVAIKSLRSEGMQGHREWLVYIHAHSLFY